MSFSAAKGLGIKYVWHHGGRFMARMRSGYRVHVFESLSDLQAIQCASRNKILHRQTNDGRRGRVGLLRVKGILGQVFYTLTHWKHTFMRSAIF